MRKVRHGLTIILIIIFLTINIKGVAASGNILTIKKLPIERHLLESRNYLKDTIYNLYFIQKEIVNDREKRDIFEKLTRLSRSEIEKTYSMVKKSQPTNSDGFTEISVEKEGTYLLLEEGERYFNIDGNSYRSTPMLVSIKGSQLVEVKPVDENPDQSESSEESEESDESKPSEENPDDPKKPKGPKSPSPSTGDIDLVPILLILAISAVAILFLLRKSKKKSD